MYNVRRSMIIASEEGHAVPNEEGPGAQGDAVQNGNVPNTLTLASATPATNTRCIERHARAHTHTHTHTHFCTHAHNTHLRVRHPHNPCKVDQMDMHTHTHTRTPDNPCKVDQMDMHTHTHIRAPIFTHTRTRTLLRLHLRSMAGMCTHTHTHTHTQHTQVSKEHAEPRGP